VRLTSSTLGGRTAQNRLRNDATAVGSGAELGTTVTTRNFLADSLNDWTTDSDGLGSHATFAALGAFALNDDLLFDILSHLLFDVTLVLATLVREVLLLSAIVAVLQLNVFSADAEGRAATRSENERGDKRGDEECKVFHWCGWENNEKW
jgi:hypothetical protein